MSSETFFFFFEKKFWNILDSISLYINSRRQKLSILDLSSCVDNTDKVSSVMDNIKLEHGYKVCMCKFSQTNN